MQRSGAARGARHHGGGEQIAPLDCHTARGTYTLAVAGESSA
jgi:hypothetical protein